MKPYYQQNGIEIFHADCREVLPTLPPDSVDLLVTDPPYGVEWVSNHRQQKFDAIAGDDSMEAGRVAVGLAIRVLRRGRHGYVFGRFDLSHLPISPQTELVWDKVNHNSGNLNIPWGSQHEYIQFFTNLRSEAAKANGSGTLAGRLRRGTVLRYLRPNADAVTLHPTEKPVELVRELIEASSHLGELVLDCFMGSGSTIAAAKQEGRRAIGIEIEEKYCELAAKRLSQEVFSFEVATAERGEG